VILNGQRIYDEAIQEIEKLEADIRSTWEEPVNFLVG
jgi:hypothetical protein